MRPRLWSALAIIFVAAASSTSASADEIAGGCEDRGLLTVCEKAAFDALVRKLDALEVDLDKARAELTDAGKRATEDLEAARAGWVNERKILRLEADFWRTQAGARQPTWWEAHTAAIAYSSGVGGAALATVGGVLLATEGDKGWGAACAALGLTAMAFGAGVAF